LKITGPNLFALDSRVSALGSNSLADNFRHNWSNLCTRSQLNEHAPGEARYAPLLYPTNQVLGERRVLLKVEDEEGNVVFLRAGGVVARKTGDVVEEGVSETSGRDIEPRFQEFPAACLAEFLLHGVLGFEESVRVEQTAISGTNADFHRGVSRFGKHAQHQAVLFDFLYVTCGAGGQHERRMACSGVAQQALL